MTDDLKRRGLGRGLSALFGDEDKMPATDGPVHKLPIEKLHPGKYQPRQKFDAEAVETLAHSIREKGVLQPLLVRPHPARPGEYEIVAGERRWRAAQAAQLHDVPVVLREIGDRDALEIALVENLQRQDLSILEEAAAYRRLMDEFHHTQDAAAQALGKSRSHIANTLRLLDLPEPVKQLLDDGKLSPGHARALLGVTNATAIAAEIVKKGLNVRQTERLAQRAKGRAPAASLVGGPDPRNGKDADARAAERDLSAALGLSVSIDPKGGTKGSLTIRYQTLDQLEDIIERLLQSPAS